MNFIKRLFCKHRYYFIEEKYSMLGWIKCEYCGKEKYSGKNVDYSHFSLGKFYIK